MLQPHHHARSTDTPLLSSAASRKLRPALPSNKPVNNSPVANSDGGIQPWFYRQISNPRLVVVLRGARRVTDPRGGRKVRREGSSGQHLPGQPEPPPEPFDG